MRKSLVALLFVSTIASAKGIIPWAHESLPPGNEAPLAESLSVWKGGGWVPSRISSYAYDARGALLRAETWNDSADIPRYKGTWSWEFAYGADSLVSGVRERIRLDSGWKDSTRFPLWIDLDLPVEGGRSAELDLIWEKDRIIWGTRILKGHTATGKETSRDEFLFDGSGWSAVAHMDFTYDTEGRLLSQVADATSRDLYAYDTGGNLLSYERSLWKSGAWLAETAENREYDAAGRLVLRLYRTRIQGTVGPLDSTHKETRTYPDPLSHETVFWSRDSLGWIPQTRQTERFDSRGNVTERMKFGYIGSGWTESEKTVFGYDAANNVTEQSEYIRQDSGWVPTFIARGRFDAENRSREGYSEYYSQGVRMSKEEFAIRYDSRGNLLESSQRSLSPEGAVLRGKKVTYAYAATSSLPPRPRAVRNRLRPKMALRGNAILILEARSVRDLRGRIAIPR